MASSLIDFIARHSGVLRQLKFGTKLIVAGQNAYFEQQQPDDLRRLINDAMRKAVAYYKRNVGHSGLAIPDSEIEEMAFGVVVHFLYMYNKWKADNPVKYRRVKVELARGDLKSNGAIEQCLWFAQQKYREQYAPFVAALAGLSISEYHEWETCRRRYWDR